MSVQATLGPWQLCLTQVNDEIAHAISEQKYPYRNGADMEDMGVDPETFRFSCILKNDDYGEDGERYKNIRNWFLSIFYEPVELVHPVLGTLRGYPKNASFGEDRRKRCADFSFDFVVSGIQPEESAWQDVRAANEEEAVALNADVQDGIAEDMATEGVPDASGSDWSLMDKWASMGDAARAFATKCQKAVGKLEGYIDAVVAPVDAISATIDYSETLSGSLAQSIEKACESFLALARKLDVSEKKSSSRAVVTALVSDLTAAQAALTDSPESVQGAFATLACATAAGEAARLFADDESALRESVSGESVEADDADGRAMVTPSSSYMLSPADLEDTLATVNQFVQDSLSRLTSPERVKRMVANLAEQVLRVKLEYMTTRSVLVRATTPLHRILLDNGLKYKAADRVCALNGIKNPTFVTGEVLLYA